MKLRTLAASLGAAAVLGSGALLMGAGIGAEMKPAKVGDQAPDFKLMDLEGNAHTLSDLTEKGHIVVLEWFNPDCPFVRKHYRDDTMTMLKMEQELEGKNVTWLRINSGHADHPTATKERNMEAAEEWGIPTSSLLMDHSGDVGRAYGAKRTPEMYIIDTEGTLVYHGAIDNRPDAAGPGDENYVANALEEVMAGQTVSNATTRAYGCSVKYD